MIGLWIHLSPSAAHPQHLVLTFEGTRTFRFRFLNSPVLLSLLPLLAFTAGWRLGARKGRKEQKKELKQKRLVSQKGRSLIVGMGGGALPHRLTRWLRAGTPGAWRRPVLPKAWRWHTPPCVSPGTRVSAPPEQGPRSVFSVHPFTRTALKCSYCEIPRPYTFSTDQNGRYPIVLSPY